MAQDDVPTIVGSARVASEGANAPKIDRYEVGDVIGRGGMGEIRTARDARVGRDVAIKLMLPEHRDAEALARFVREAQIQGRLEHPAVVPVHDLGVDPAGSPYFVMKRVAGTTLAEVFAAYDADAAKAALAWPRRTLLARFVDVCLAAELAHTRGIVHRDLKPANIMLGDFGETYVLDWGLARVTAVLDQPIAPLPGDLGTGNSIAAGLLGTPGYMAPEQITGAPIDGRTDVFALGLLLYEIVAGKPALPHGTSGVEATLAANQLHPRDADPNVPIELDDVCAAATSRALDDRPTARALGERVQAYLDGDRDLERRRELAARHAAAAQDALAAHDDRARSTAMREAGRALALDPESSTAQDVLGLLLLEAPDTLPVAAKTSADAERAATRMRTIRWMVWAYVILFGSMFLLFVFPVRHLLPLAAMIAGTGITGVLVWNAGRQPRGMDDRAYLYALLSNSITLSFSAIAMGPLFLVPAFLITSLAGALSTPMKRGPAWTIVPHFAAVAVPLVLEWTHVLPPSYRVDGGGLTLLPYSLELMPATAPLLVILASAIAALTTAALVVAHRRDQEDKQNRMHAQTWHLRQLLPQPRRDK